MTDQLTIITVLPPLFATKVYKSDGTVASYGKASSCKIGTASVANLTDLSAALTKLEAMPRKCVIRGLPKPESERVPGPKEGTWARKKIGFTEVPHHWMMIDIDNYRPGFADPVLEPVLAIQDFITEHMPPCFHRAGFHWQLSSSAGTKGKEGLLKAHVWFWLATPYDSDQLTAWAALYPMVDKTVYRRVQPHYTAAPIFEEGVPDPVPLRSGFLPGPDVALVIDETVLSGARATGAGTADGHDMTLVDPSQKPGLIGLFHRVFDAERVLLEMLDQFEQVTDRRYTWTEGGGTPEGVWVHEDGLHVGSSHNTWPLDGIANLWDLTRVIKFGDLDAAPTGDDFVDMDAQQVGQRPSDRAMYEWVKTLPEMQEEIEAAATVEAGLPDADTLRSAVAAATHWRDAVAAAPDELELRDRVCRGIREDVRLGDVEKDALANAVKKRLQALGVTQSLAVVRKMLNTAAIEVRDNVQRPEWLHNYVYVTDRDMFYRYNSEEWLSRQGFNAKFNRRVRNAGGEAPDAYTLALEQHNVPIVTKGLYWPGADELFMHEEVRVVNLYRPSSVPVAATVLTAEDNAAIDMVKRHLSNVCGGREWLTEYFIDWMAHNVIYPGRKITFAPLIKGIEGDGKSQIGALMAAVMGQANVNIISPKAIATDFNGWAEGQALGVLEEIRMVGHNRYDILNAVKPVITNSTIAIHRKGRDEYNCPNVTNYIAFTNHEDALPLEDTDRRWLVIFTPWKSAEEMAAYLGEPATHYFDRLANAVANHGPALRGWLIGRGVSAAFKRFDRAPDTPEKQAMVAAAVPDDDRLVREVIEEGGVGFTKTLLSSGDLTNHIREATDSRPPESTKLHRILGRMGFQQVPFVVKWNGRTRRIWVTGQHEKLKADTPESRTEIRKVLDETMAAQIENDFKD